MSLITLPTRSISSLLIKGFSELKSESKDISTLCQSCGAPVPIDTITEGEQLHTDLTSQIKELEEKNRKLTHDLKLSIAEQRNSADRWRSQSQESLKRGQTQVIRSLLPTLDTFIMAKETEPPILRTKRKVKTADVLPFIDGLLSIHPLIEQALSQFDVSSTDPTGQQFSPTYHEAVAAIHDPLYADGEVVQCTRQGYQQGERVIRAAQVIVNKHVK
eukprot:gnl/Dysnectes_brevis/857_a950_4856.p1 GENE.gnl/Dysnectes_brevis/857_a950_4856~~gnl/Dysnectes_brevis/857_a950_4856.p1  ORF type:complete len:217 (+),score=40.00 gnl/Dysnectes_brevis/857_a950_4856:85-735(+)